MKKTFFALSALAAVLFASCEKTPETGNNPGLKDDDKIDETLHPSLKGSEYVVVSLDEYSTKDIQSRIKASYQIDDTNVFLYIWENTYTAGSSDGLNFYDMASSWTSLVVGTVGWSGAGFCVVNPTEIPPFVEKTSDLASWTFHMAYKGAAGAAHIVILTWNGATYKFAVGDGSLEDAGVKYDAIAPVSGKFEVGKWNEYEISLAETGLDYTKAAKADNLVSVLSGGKTGTTLDVDAIFFYKK